MKVSNLQFTVGETTYTWNGTTRDLFSNKEKGLSVGDVRVIGGMMLYVDYIFQPNGSLSPLIKPTPTVYWASLDILKQDYRTGQESIKNLKRLIFMGKEE